MTKIEHDVVLFAQCATAAFKSPQHPRTAHGGCAGGHRALHMAARVCFLREQHAGDAVFAMATRGVRASIPRGQSLESPRACYIFHYFVNIDDVILF